MKYIDRSIIAWTIIGSHIAPVHFFMPIRAKWKIVDQMISGRIDVRVLRESPYWAKGRGL